MRKRMIATVMAFLLSVAMLAGCGDASRDDDRSSRSRREHSYEREDDDSDGGGLFSNWSAKDSSEHDVPVKDDTDISQDNSTAADDNDVPAAEKDPFINDEDSQGTDNRTPSSGSDSSNDNSTPSSSNGNSTDNNAPSNNSGSSNDNSVPSNSTASAEDYINDMREFLELNEAEEMDYDDPMQLIPALQALVDDLQVTTPEGLAMKEDIQEMITLLNNVLLNMDNLSMDDLTAMTDRVTELSELFEKHADDFEKAAIAAGVDPDSLDDMEDFWGI